MENRWSKIHLSVIKQVGLKAATLFGVLDNLQSAPGTHKNSDGFFHVHGSRLAREVNTADKPALKKLISKLDAVGLIDVAMIGNARHFRILKNPRGKYLEIDWMIALCSSTSSAAIVALIKDKGGILPACVQKIADTLGLGSYNTAVSAIKRAKQDKLICSDVGGLGLHWKFEETLEFFDKNERHMISFYETRHGESLKGWSKSVSNTKTQEIQDCEPILEQRFFVKKKETKQDFQRSPSFEKGFQKYVPEHTLQGRIFESSNDAFLKNTPILQEHLLEHSRSALRGKLNGSPAAGLETSNGTCKNQNYNSKPTPPEAKPPQFRNAPPNTEEAQAFVMKLIQQAQRQP